MKKLIFISLICLFIAGSVRGQETEFNYQIILETKGEYNDLDKSSELNPDNRMNIKEVSAVTQLYPILKFRHSQQDFSASLQVEGNFTNYNFSGDSLLFSFQELYAQFAMSEKHFISVGKRRLNWGSGLLWNPTNFYIQKTLSGRRTGWRVFFRQVIRCFFPAECFRHIFSPRKE